MLQTVLLFWTAQKYRLKSIITAYQMLMSSCFWVIWQHFSIAGCYNKKISFRNLYTFIWVQRIKYVFIDSEIYTPVSIMLFLTCLMIGSIWNNRNLHCVMIWWHYIVVCTLHGPDIWLGGIISDDYFWSPRCLGSSPDNVPVTTHFKIIDGVLRHGTVFCIIQSFSTCSFGLCYQWLSLYRFEMFFHIWVL